MSGKCIPHVTTIINPTSQDIGGAATQSLDTLERVHQTKDIKHSSIGQNLSASLQTVPSDHLQNPQDNKQRVGSNSSAVVRNNVSSNSYNNTLKDNSVYLNKRPALIQYTGKPATEFNHFPELSLELKYKIWNLAARSQKRIFEITWHQDMNAKEHYLFKVSKQTNRVPAILEVNKESRKEAKLVFEKRILNNYTSASNGSSSSGTPCTWFNPELDTIYFGGNTCIRTVVDFFNQFRTMTFPKVAFLCAPNIHNGCDWGRLVPRLNQGIKYQCHVGACIHGGCTNIQALHGIPRAIALNDMVPGSPSTKELFLVVRSQRDEYAPGEMPNTLTFRPILQDGLNEDQRDAKEYWEEQLRRVRRGLDFGCGANRWNYRTIPDFKFVSLAPEVKDGKGRNLKHGGMMLDYDNMQQLVKYGKKFIPDLIRRTGVDIRPAAPYWYDDMEFCFYSGTDEAIERCKREIFGGLCLTTEDRQN